MADAPKVKYYRVAVVILGLLCVLLLVVITWMGIRHKAETEERDHLQIKKNQVDRENRNLHALTKNLTAEKNNLIAKNRNLTAEKGRLLNTSCKYSNKYDKISVAVLWPEI